MLSAWPAAATRGFANQRSRAASIPKTPAICARILGGLGVKLTIGNDKSTIQKLTAMGAKHQNSTVEDIVVDEKNRIVSTAAYMLAKRISQASTGIEALVNAVLKMTDKSPAKSAVRHQPSPA